MSATAPTYSQFTTEFPVFSTLSEAMVQAQLTGSAEMLDPLSWGNFYSYAVSLDAAHKLVLNAIAAGGINAAFQAAIGPVISAGGAGVSASFAGPRQNLKGYAEIFYSSTSYGKQFLLLQNRVINNVMGTNDFMEDFFPGPGFGESLLP